MFRRLFIGAVILFDAFSSSAQAERLNILAASSTTEFLIAAKNAYTADNPNAPEIKLIFASSSTLARQIEAGAPANVFLSANQTWMDYLANKKLLVKKSRRDIFSNRLVLAGPASKRPEVQFDSHLLERLGGNKLIIGNPNHVPAGHYAKQALITANLWGLLKGQLAYASSARAAVSLIQRTNSPGIVYATDMRVADDLEVYVEIDKRLHTPIRYSIAVLKDGATLVAAQFVAFLQATPQRKLIRLYGFLPLSAAE